MNSSTSVSILALLVVGVANAVLADTRGIHAQFMPSTRFSDLGLRDSNGQEATDRDKGQERATDRRSADGNEHSKATAHKHVGTQVRAKHASTLTAGAADNK